MDLCWQNDVSALNTLSRFVIAFLPRSKHLFTSWLQSPPAVILEAKKKCHCFHFSPFYLPRSVGTRCHDLRFFEYWVLSQLFHSPLSPLSGDSLVPLHFLPLEWYFCISEVIDISPGNLDSSLCFIQPSPFFHVWFYLASWPAYTFLRRQVRWSGMEVRSKWKGGQHVCVLHSLLWLECITNKM